MSKKKEIIEVIENSLAQISILNGYHTDFARRTYWQNRPTEYNENHLNFRDEREDYQLENLKYDAELEIVIEAVVIENNGNASELGTLALEDLIKAVKNCFLAGTLFNLDKSYKYVETKGKTAALIELSIKVLYKF